MVAVECKDLNRELCERAQQCVNLLLSTLAERNRDRNVRLVKNLESIQAKISKRPTTEVELVELEGALDQLK